MGTQSPEKDNEKSFTDCLRKSKVSSQIDRYRKAVEITSKEPTTQISKVHLHLLQENGIDSFQLWETGSMYVLLSSFCYTSLTHTRKGNRHHIINQVRLPRCRL